MNLKRMMCGGCGHEAMRIFIPHDQNRPMVIIECIGCGSRTIIGSKPRLVIDWPSVFGVDEIDDGIGILAPR